MFYLKFHLNNAKTHAKTHKMHQHPQSINFELFLVVENHCVFSAHILKLCGFFLQKCACKTQNADQTISLNKL